METRQVVKPLQVNPIAHSQPMGATLAFLGIKDALPLMHGAQGCASFTKVFYTRHFNEPIAINNTSVTDITAVLDGGDYTIAEAVKNITQKVKPSLIGLHTTGLTETKGDDVRSIRNKIGFEYVCVNTPDFEGGMESGWALTAKALVEQLTIPATVTKANKLVLFPHVSMQPIEVEKVKEFCEGFGFEVCALPDISTSLDGYLDEGQGKLAKGGISVEEVKELAMSRVVITIGRSMRCAAEALLEKNPTMTHLHFDHLMGLDQVDAFVASLMQIRHIDPLPGVKRWRARLQDAMLDTHFHIGSSQFVLSGEPDMLSGMCELIHSVGGSIKVAISTVHSDILENIKADNVIVGDLEDMQDYLTDGLCVISNFHAERIVKQYKNVGLCLRGFPNYEELGNQLKNDQLYEGSTYMLFELANTIAKTRAHE